MGWGRRAIRRRILLVLALHVSLDPFGIEDFEEPQQAFTLAKGIDTLETAVGFDFGVGKWKKASHPGDRSPGVEIGEGFPNPVEVRRKRRLVRERLGLDPLFGLNLAQPVRLLGSRTLRPVEVSDQFPASLSALAASKDASFEAIRMIRAKKPASFSSESSFLAFSTENSMSLPSRSLMPVQPLMMFSA